MASTHDGSSESLVEARSELSKPLPAHKLPEPPKARVASHRWRKRLLWIGIVAGLGIGSYLLVPVVQTALNTVSTDDAYVNSHVTLVAPRVAGQVGQVPVDDNYRVKKGDLLVQLDREPFQVQVDIKKAAVVNAEADLKAAEAQVRATLGLARSQRWKLQTASEQVDNEVALLRARVAALKSKEATLDARGPTSTGRRHCSIAARSRGRNSISVARLSGWPKP